MRRQFKGIQKPCQGTITKREHVSQGRIALTNMKKYYERETEREQGNKKTGTCAPVLNNN